MTENTVKNPEIIEKILEVEEIIVEKPKLISVTEVKGFDRYDDVFQEFTPSQIVRFERKNDFFYFYSENKIALEIVFFDEKIVRFRYAMRSIFEPYFSYAVVEKAIEKVFSPTFSEEDDIFLLKTNSISCHIEKKNLQIKIFDDQNQLISEDAAPFYARSTIMKGTTDVKISKKISHKERFFGLGDKSCALDLRGQKLQNWNSDAFAFGKKSDPLYRSIPFFYGLKDEICYGIFLDNSFRSHFDFDSTEQNELTFSADGGEMCYYFFAGKELLEVAKNYIYLTGKPEMPPIWSLGFHQCRWSYFPDERVLELAKEFRQRQIPCDAIYLDIDYMDDYRCFTWDKKYFPNPKQLIFNLLEVGFQTVVMIDPGIKADENYFVFQDGLEKNVFCRRTNGELLMAPVWPSDCVFPDFTNPKARAWWGEFYRELYEAEGISGFWNDMNEPAVFKVNNLTFSDEILHDCDGHQTNHAKAHNIYGMMMSRATIEGLKKIKPQKRPFLLTRASFAGGQRYAAVWTGDNVADWENLRLANIQCQRLSISGYSFVGTDIGGFVNMPSGELFIRWLQLGIFHPLFRIHSMGNHSDGSSEVEESEVEAAAKLDRLDREPWAFGAPFTGIAKATIELRYRLLPYLYTTFRAYTTEGVPVIKSLNFSYFRDKNIFSHENAFIFGKNILVSPVLLEAQTTQTQYLPKGNWFYFWTGKIYSGGAEITFPTPLAQIPFFVQAGTVLPLYPIQQFTNEKPIEELTLHVYFEEGEHRSELYEDAGEGYGYLEEDFSEKTFVVRGASKKISLSQQKVGKRKDDYQRCRIIFYGIPFRPTRAVADQTEVDFFASSINSTVFTVLVEHEFGELVLE